MSPVVLRQAGFIFWFHSYDVIHEHRASVHVGKGSPDDYNDAKVWLEPAIEVASDHERILERWYEHRGDTE